MASQQVVRVVLLTLMCASCIQGCGISTHIEIGERTGHYLGIFSNGVDFRQLIKKHPDAYQAGCPYPDAFYPDLCYDGIYHSVAEDTHWVPFLNASVHYIRNTYPQPWNETAEKLVVFILAVVSHQVADVNWHSLGIDQGFLRTMGMVNYHGSYSAAHSDGDFGGDVLNLYELDMDYVPVVDDWYVPVNDLLNIYEEMYGVSWLMSPEVVVECTNWLFLGRLGEHLGVVEYLYPDYAESSTFLVDRLQDFYLGGVDDMAVWSANVYQHLVTMLEHGTEVCTLPNNPIYIECNVLSEYTARGRYKRSTSSKPAHNGNNNVGLKNPGKALDWLEMSIGMAGPDDYVIEEIEGGVMFKASDKYNKRVAKWMKKRNRRHRKYVINNRANSTAPDALYTTQYPYSRLGESLLSADVNNDGDLDLIIGAPGYSSLGNHQRGRVYIVYGSNEGLPVTNMIIENSANRIIEGPELNGRFGTSLAVVDINADGYSDLVVSAPSVGSDLLYYNGEVYVYYGSLSGLSSTPDATITCTERYCNFGWSLSSGDVNHDGRPDLLVGSPYAPSAGEQRGFVGAIYSNPAFPGGSLSENVFDWRKDGDQDYEWFGYSVTSGHNSPADGWLVIGAPSHRICYLPDCTFDSNDIQSVGRVSTFATPLVGDVETHDLVGNVTFGQLGYEVSGFSDPGQELLGIAATTRDFDLSDLRLDENITEPIIQLGYVSIYDSGDVTQPPFFSVVGDRQFGRVGASIQYADVNADSKADVIVSAPLRSETIEEGREAGLVYIFYNDEAKRGQVLVVNQADVILGLDENKARYGYSVAPTLASNGQLQLSVSAPHSNNGGRLTGLVAIHQM